MKHRFFFLEDRQECWSDNKYFCIAHLCAHVCVAFWTLKWFIESRDKVKIVRLPPRGQWNLELKFSRIRIKLHSFEIHYFRTDYGSSNLVYVAVLIK